MEGGSNGRCTRSRRGGRRFGEGALIGEANVVATWGRWHLTGGSRRARGAALCEQREGAGGVD
jgi:hypothetical protein